MPDIQELADEIFLEIFSHLACAELARACLISRRLGSLAQFVLYQTPTIDRSRLDHRMLELFLRTILSRPILARFVQELRLDGLIFGLENPACRSNINLFTSAARGLELPYSMQWPNDHLQLLLHLLPNLRRLHMLREDTLDPFDRFIEDYVIHDRTRALPVAFRSLRHVHFEWNVRMGLTPNMLMNLFRLPSIRTITVHLESHFSPEPNSRFSSSDPEFKSTVKQLTLRSGSFSLCSLTQILDIPRALTHLSLVDWDITGLRFDWPEFGVVLRHVCSTLEHLQLSICDYTDMGHPVLDDWNPNTIGSLRDWPVLTSLRCSLTLLLGQGPDVSFTRLVDVLPLGIRELEIEADQHWSAGAALHQIVELVDQKDIGGLESLAVVTVGMKLAEGAGLLSATYSAAGVRLMVSPCWC